jgi:hypothetical protein
MSDDKQIQYEKGKPVAVRFDAENVYVTLADGRVIGNPLAWHPWLAKATDQERAKVKLYHLSVWWPDLDDGLDIQGMMEGIQPRLIPTE